MEQRTAGPPRFENRRPVPGRGAPSLFEASDPTLTSPHVCMYCTEYAYSVHTHAISARSELCHAAQHKMRRVGVCLLARHLSRQSRLSRPRPASLRQRRCAAGALARGPSPSSPPETRPGPGADPVASCPMTAKYRMPTQTWASGLRHPNGPMFRGDEEGISGRAKSSQTSHRLEFSTAGRSWLSNQLVIRPAPSPCQAMLASGPASLRLLAVAQQRGDGPRT